MASTHTSMLNASFQLKKTDGNDFRIPGILIEVVVRVGT
jgi:hypothetical protein